MSTATGSPRTSSRFAVVSEIARLCRGSTAGVRLTSGLVGSATAGIVVLSDRFESNPVLSFLVTSKISKASLVTVLLASIGGFLYLRLAESRLERIAARFMGDEVIVEQIIRFHEDWENWAVLPGMPEDCFRRHALVIFIKDWLTRSMGRLRFGLADQCSVAADELADEVIRFLEGEGAIRKIENPTFERIYQLDREAFQYVI